MSREPLYILKWHQAMGIEAVVEETPLDAFALKAEKDHKKQQAMEAAKQQVQQISQSVTRTVAAQADQASKSPISAKLDTKRLADAATTLEELRQAVTSFDGLAITKTATNVVFSDGNPQAQVLFIGEAPGADEDREGIPFCGQSGQLLRQVIKYTGLTKTNNFYITNSLFWRPPGNRKPTPEELAVCRPFVEKHIALINPKLIVAVGATAVASVLEKSGAITKMRGQFIDYKNPYLDRVIPVMPTFHPSYLLRSPGQKKYAWLDSLKIQEFLESESASS